MEKRGIKESIELLRGMKRLAIICHRAQKGGGSAAEIGQRIGMAIAMDPLALGELKAAADGIADVPSELRDLDFTESLTFIAEAGKLAAEAATEIKAAS